MQTGGISPKQLSNRGVTGLGWSSTYGNCRKCGAFYGELGLEPTPKRHIENLRLVGMEIMRVLRPDGVFWFNYGDTYAGSYSEYESGMRLMMPHRIAQAFIEDGWILRDDAIWWKENPMPNPVTGWRWVRHKIKTKDAKLDWRQEAIRKDGVLEGPAHVSGGNTGFRPKAERAEWKSCPGCEKCKQYGGYILKQGSWRHTDAYENIFQFVKKMQYFCDQELVRDEYTEPLDRWGGDQKSLDDHLKGGSENPYAKAHRERDMRPYPGGKNPRNVFHLPTSSYSGKHFAVYPEALIEPLIKASVPRHTCPICGTGWAPVIDNEEEVQARFSASASGPYRERTTQKVNQLLGYRPTCEHYPDKPPDDLPFWTNGAIETLPESLIPIPGVVLDPFGGSGTTAKVAKSLMRRWVVIDVGFEYIDQQVKLRTGQGSPSTALDGLPMFDNDE
jgi:hypothetical protein